MGNSLLSRGTPALPVSMLHVPMLSLHTQSRSHAMPAYSVPFPCCACILSPVPMLCLHTQSCSHAMPAYSVLFPSACMPAYSVLFPCYACILSPVPICMYACILSPVPMLCLHTQSRSRAICILSLVSIFNAACTHTHTFTSLHIDVMSLKSSACVLPALVLLWWPQYVICWQWVQASVCRRTHIG